MFQLFSIAGYGFTFTDLMFVVAYLSVAYQFFVQKRVFTFLETKVLYSIILLTLSFILSAIGLLTWGNDASLIQYFKTLSHFIYVSLWGVFLLGSEIKPDAYFKLIRAILVASLLINIYAIYQLFARIYDLPLAYIQISNQQFLTRGFDKELGEANQIVLKFENFYRATSIFSEPSALASFNLMNVIFLIVPKVSKVKPFIQKNWLNNLILIFVLIVLMLSFSLTGLSLISVFLISLIFINKININKFIKNFIILAVLLIAIDQIVSNYTNISVLNLFYQRVEGLIASSPKKGEMVVGESAPDRIASIKNAITLYKESPIFGIGLGNTYFHPKSTARFSQSAFFSILSEAGIIGAIALIFFYFNIFRGSLFVHNEVLNTQSFSPELATMQTLPVFIIILTIVSGILLSDTIITTSYWSTFGIFVSTYKSTLLLKNRNSLSASS